VRVVGGVTRGVALQGVPGDTTRPILDRVKTALFDILRPRLSDATFLDLFAGSGSVGIEALSQGAKEAIFLDIAKAAVATIKANLTATKLSDKAQVRHAEAFQYIKNLNTAKNFDVIFVAPPQYKGMWGEMLRTLAERVEVLAPEGVIVVQIDPREFEPLDLTTLTEIDSRKYGNSMLLFFAHR
jgi:16S rRNA (guanine(966)-N(2))-methyltransferase RsmD